MLLVNDCKYPEQNWQILLSVFYLVSLFFDAWSFPECLANDWCLCVAHSVRFIRSRYTKAPWILIQRFKKAKLSRKERFLLAFFFSTTVTLKMFSIPFSICYLFQNFSSGPTLSSVNASHGTGNFSKYLLLKRTFLMFLFSKAIFLLPW